MLYDQRSRYAENVNAFFRNLDKASVFKEFEELRQFKYRVDVCGPGEQFDPSIVQPCLVACGKRGQQNARFPGGENLIELLNTTHLLQFEGVMHEPCAFCLCIHSFLKSTCGLPFF